MKYSIFLRGLLALVVTMGALLLLDMENRQSAKKQKLIKIAIFKISSRIVLDETEKGLMGALTARGYIGGKNCFLLL
jgi:ABC-type uncharacterized transport system substrate-binding protein